MSKYYITTPIYYVNDVPHIGHAYTTIAADVLARYHRKKGDDVFFLTGTDEHGAKIAEAAKKAVRTPREFVDELVPLFQATWKKLNIDYSEFFRTTNPEHEKLVQEFVAKLVENGFVEKRQYEGLYCIACERYYREDELIDGKCPDHKKECVKQSEENYFFLLSKFGEKILKKIETDELAIGPEARRNEVKSKIKLGLEDVSISRQAVEWGVPFPGDESQTIYVWIDALLNYYTATKLYHKEDFWPADLHLMAKDILWFHAVIWPAMLLAYGGDNFPLPRKVFAHGFFTINGQKMSKTIGNVIDPNEVVDKFGADAVRYALLREFPFGEDGDISVEKIAGNYSDLANTLGNLVQRTIVMINKFEIQISKHETNSNGQKGSKHISDFGFRISSLIERLEFSRALEKIMAFAAEQNQYINENAPWVLAKEGKQERLTEVLITVYDNLILITQSLEPFMPETSEKIKKQLETLQPEPLFPRLEL
jgi:methionyl-tRNA synthetase